MKELFTELWLRLRETKREDAVNYPPRPGKGKELGPWNLERAEQVFPGLWP